MPTASAIIDQVRLRFGDTAGDFLTTDRCLTWLDEAQNAFVEILYPLRRTKSFTVVANQEYFTLPDELIILEVVVVTQGVRHRCQYRIPTEFERLKTSMRMTYPPQYWTKKDEKLYIWPLFPLASASTTVVGSLASSTTASTFSISSGATFRDYGRAILGTQEEIEYTGKSTTALTGVTRGLGGTTASTHASNATLVQTDFEIQYPRRASALASTSTPDLPSVYQQKLQTYLLYLAELSRGNSQKAMTYYDLWKRDLQDCEYNVKKQQVQRPLRVIDADRGGFGWQAGDFG